LLLMAVPEHFPITRLALDRNQQERVTSEIVLMNQ